MLPFLKTPPILPLLTSITLALAGCTSGSQDGHQNQQQTTVVSVQTIAPQSVTLDTELAGRTTAYTVAEVRPQVSGIIQKRLFEEGSEVKAGQPLYQIDASLYQAAVDQAAANLASARASAQAADERVRRFAPLAKIQAIAEQDYTDALAEARVAGESARHGE